MTPVAILTMTVICGVVWGGLVSLVIFAVRSERRKRSDADRPGA